MTLFVMHRPLKEQRESTKNEFMLQYFGLKNALFSRRPCMTIWLMARDHSHRGEKVHPSFVFFRHK